MVRKAARAPAFVVCWALSLYAATPGDQAPPGAQQGSAASAQQGPAANVPQPPKKPELGPWWQKNALEYKPLPARWLFHADGTLSYMNASGNTSGSTLDISAGAEVRKDRFTSNSFAQMSRKDVVYGFSQGTVNYDERTLREQLDYAVTARLKLVAGIEDYRNTLMFMDKRLNVYGGTGATLLRTENQQVTLTAGLGHADFTFDRARMISLNPHGFASIDTSPGSGGALGMQSWRWRVSPRFTFSQAASYMQYFESALGHRWTVDFTGALSINKLFSFNVTYRVKEETNTIIKALRVFPQDRGFLMGIKASI